MTVALSSRIPCRKIICGAGRPEKKLRARTCDEIGMRIARSLVLLVQAIYFTYINQGYSGAVLGAANSMIL